VTPAQRPSRLQRVPGASYETGVVLSGGGARAAYQIGVLRAIAQVLGRGSTTPFRVICGTSAGAVNAALLVADADNFRRGVARLLRLWRKIEVPHVLLSGRLDDRALAKDPSPR
jgi:NTE family protein